MYGFDFQERAKAGLGMGTLIYDVLMCYHHCRSNKLNMVFVEKEHNKIIAEYYGLFSEIGVLPRAEVETVWPICPDGFCRSPPGDVDPYEWYSDLLKELLIIVPTASENIEKLIENSGFKESDVLLHVEPGEVAIEYYVDKTVKLINEECPGSRVFLCTRDTGMVEKCTELFSKVSIEMTHSDCLELVVIMMMSRAKYLIGGRMSYLFRVGELLRYPLPSLNLKDSDMHGKAEYARKDEPVVLPMLPKRYYNFVNPDLDAYDLDDGVVCIPNFINPDLLDDLKKDIADFNDEWWSRAIHPSTDLKNPAHLKYGDGNIPVIESHARALKDTWFTYMFWKVVVSNKEHYDGCYCFVCRLEDTIKSYEVVEFFSYLVNKDVTCFGETFAAMYRLSDYLGTHHDDKKGPYAFVLGLSEDWKEEYGGTTDFLSPDKKEIIKTVTPGFGSLTVFKVNPNGSTHHRVNEVLADKRRISFTGWFFAKSLEK